MNTQTPATVHDISYNDRNISFRDAKGEYIAIPRNRISLICLVPECNKVTVIINIEGTTNQTHSFNDFETAEDFARIWFGRLEAFDGIKHTDIEGTVRYIDCNHIAKVQEKGEDALLIAVDGMEKRKTNIPGGRGTKLTTAIPVVQYIKCGSTEDRDILREFTGL